VAGFLGREDGKRPAWFNRVQLAPVVSIPPDMQEHLANACHVICLKVRQEVTCDPSSRPPGPERPATGWQAGLICVRVLWRTLFAAAAMKGPVQLQAVPVLFMISCESLRQAARRMLTKLWNEVQVQFTGRVNKYRGLKSRPNWSVLERLQFEVYGVEHGFGMHDPGVHPPSSAGVKPAASLQDFLEEVLALRFAIDWLSASMRDAQDFLDKSTRRIYKRPPQRSGTLQAAVTNRGVAVSSFATVWSEDGEIRAVSSLAARLMDGLEGPAAAQAAATCVGQMLLAMWKGAEPLLSHLATSAIARMAESQAVSGTLPLPRLLERDEDASSTRGAQLVAFSYAPPSADTQDMMASLPRGVLRTILKVQATFRGYVFRARHFARARAVASYCKAVQWPLGEAQEEENDDDDPRERRKRRKAGRVDATKLSEQIADYQPTVSKYLGGDTRKTFGGTRTDLMGTGTLGSTFRSMQMTAESSERAFPLPTADHRACADLFALYLYSMHRRRELVRMWKTVCGAYERGMDAYAELLERNPALKPMLESISAQLKRGTAANYDKGYIAKQTKEDLSLSGKIKPNDADLFKRKGTKQKEDTSGIGTPVKSPASSRRSGQSTAPALGALGASASAPQLGPLAPLQEASDAKKDQGVGIAGEYLTTYLKEMDGDDSMFKDISNSVVPLSTGTSPQRHPPHESILNEEQKAGRGSRPASEGGGDIGSRGGSQPASGQVTPSKRVKPKLDVPFCVSRAKPIWLPIKAHRFAAYRAKVLQLLPERVLQQYIDFEKQGQYPACVKLLESATPGSINVLSPATLVNNKPLLVETVLQLIVGYSGLCLRNQQGAVAVRLVIQVLDNMSLSLRDLHPGHRTVLEAYLYDTALSVCYYLPKDPQLSYRAASFFQQASERYLKLGHTNRYCKCCLRAAAVFHLQSSLSEAEFYTQQALGKLNNTAPSSLLAVCSHNAAIHTLTQQRITDAVAHLRNYISLLRQLPKLSNSWMQLFDNSQWLILKAQELWPQYQAQQVRDGVKSAWNAT